MTRKDHSGKKYNREFDNLTFTLRSVLHYGGKSKLFYRNYEYSKYSLTYDRLVVPKHYYRVHNTPNPLRLTR